MVDWQAAGNAAPFPFTAGQLLGSTLVDLLYGTVWVCRTGKESAPQVMAVQTAIQLRGGVSISVRHC